MNKRLLGFSLFVLLGLTGFVAAQTSESAGRNLGTVFAEIASGIGDFVIAFLEGINVNGSANLSLILLGLLLWIVLYSVVEEVFANRDHLGWNLTAIVVSLIMTFLSLRFIPDDFVEVIVLQYGVLGTTILTVIPFVIMMYFTVAVSKSLIISRIVWGTYVIYYFAIFSYKIAEVGEWNEALIPYSAAIVVGIFVFFFIKPLRNLLFRQKLSSKEEAALRDVRFRNLGRRIEREETESRTRTR